MFKNDAQFATAAHDLADSPFEELIFHPGSPDEIIGPDNVENITAP